MPPDDSNGIYSVPAGTIVTTGDTILPSQHNPWANDSASAISNRFSKDGRAPATGNWNINNFRLTNVGAPVAGGDAVNKTYADATYIGNIQPSVDVASAATTDIGAAASQNVRVTGTTTITSFGTVAAGTFRRVRFAAALTLTHNATSLILPGAANITTVAGDVAEFISEGSGNWRCVDYTPSAQAPYLSGTWTPTITQGATPTTSAKEGRYIRIGKMVTATLTATFSSAGTATNIVEVTGLPFTPAATVSVCAGAASFFDSGTQFYVLSAEVQTTGSVRFTANGAGNFFGTAPAVTIANTDRLTFTITYEAA